MSILNAAFSSARLGGSAVPDDVATLLPHLDTLKNQTGVVISIRPDWAPWADMSYLSEAERSNPDIAANIAAIGEVCKLITFVASDDQANYYGYWHGPDQLTLENSPIVQYDNEGQFYLCGTANLAGALLVHTCFGESFDEMRKWMSSLGIRDLPQTQYDLSDPRLNRMPDQLHREFYEKHLLSPRDA